MKGVFSSQRHLRHGWQLPVSITLPATRRIVVSGSKIAWTLSQDFREEFYLSGCGLPERILAFVKVFFTWIIRVLIAQRKTGLR